ncbi:TetR/AcrR family transcriptional regulator [Metabacillus fastidiosus]|uniref:TetR/AcrR family transcriptional regulator n=1 Tax=Metabacillus fastidiosus TaxID=1458 RepID=UPI003D2B402C
MTNSKTDPRIVRTRKLIMDSFIQLSGKKEFKDITINDIAKEATVNRATFYYHFTDKFDLLEKVLSEVLMINLNSEIITKNEFNEETIISIFSSITNFQQSLSNRCHRGYEETIEAIIKKHLETIFYKMLLKKHSSENDEALRITAVMLSWGIYGASVDWKSNSTEAPEEYIKSAVPYLLHGTDFLEDKFKN